MWSGMNKESELVSDIRKFLSYSKDVIWWERLNSGKVSNGYGGYISLCRKGTPDFVCVVMNRNKGLSLIFLECKITGGQLRPEQREFFNMYFAVTDVHCYVITTLQGAKESISRISYDHTLDLPESVG
jgi:hypothetical protein